MSAVNAALPANLSASLENLRSNLNTAPLKILQNPESDTTMVDFSIFNTALPHWDTGLVPGVKKGTSPGAAARSLVKQAVAASPEIDRAVGAFIGNALGNALGHPLEFIGVDDAAPPFDLSYHAYFDPTQLTADGEPLYFNAYNKFRTLPGQWTNDFAMALCLADSLLVHRTYDGADARVRWYCWWFYGYNNAFRHDKTREMGRNSVGAGGTLYQALLDVEKYLGREDQIPPHYKSGQEDAGNGSIMRLSPIPIFFRSDPAQAEAMAELQSKGTHPGSAAAACCRFMTFFMVRAIRKGLPTPRSTGTPAQRFIDAAVAKYLRRPQTDDSQGAKDLLKLLRASEPPSSKECNWNWRQPRPSILKAMENRQKEGSYNGYSVEAAYFGAYSLDGLAVALWALYNTVSFEDALFAVINLCGDADSNAAVAGQLAGALYGYQSIKAGPPDRQVKYAKPATNTPPSPHPSFPSMGRCWLHHLHRWDPNGEIYLRALLLCTTETPKKPLAVPSSPGGLPADVSAWLDQVLAHINTTPLKISKDFEDRDLMLDFSILDTALPLWDIAPGVKKGVPSGAAARALVERAVAASPEIDRAVGAFIGNALGDALGHPLEFIVVDDAAPPFDLSYHGYFDSTQLTADGEPLYFNAYNKFNLLPGQWTDDFSMALCLADSLIVNRSYNGGDARLRWYCWWFYGYNNAFKCDKTRRDGQGSVGLGANIHKSLQDLEQYQGREDQIPPHYESSQEDAGNGSIMRLSPIPILFRSDPAQAEAMAELQSKGTHPGSAAAACCRFMTFFMVRAIRQGLPPPTSTGTPAQRFIDDAVAEYLRRPQTDDSQGAKDLLKLLRASEPPSSKECNWNWRQPRMSIIQAVKNRQKEDDYNGYPVNPAYFGAYSLDGLAMALWAVYTTVSFEDAMFAVINLCGDADSTGAVAGQLAGALYGFQSISAGLPGKQVKYAPAPEDTTAGPRPSFSSMGECWLHHLQRWDPNGEIYIRALLLCHSKLLKADPPRTRSPDARSGGPRHGHR